MSETASAWRSAQPGVQGTEKPDPGLYDAEVVRVNLRRRNSDGQPFIIVSYRALSGTWAGHEWDELTSVQPTTYGLLKGIISGLGRDPDAIQPESDDPDHVADALMPELQAAVGAYVTVQVTQRGEYRNTMPQGVTEPVAASDIPADPADFDRPPAPPADDDIPF
jgi:hypothetical protein